MAIRKRPSRNRSRTNPATPAQQASGAGRGGVVPPADHRFPKGKSGNPKGRPNAGATVVEHYNALATAGLTEAQLRKIAKSPTLAWPRRLAAMDILQTLERSDLADMEPLLNGDVTLAELRKSGVNTTAIRKIKVKTRTLTAAGLDIGTEVTREVELHDRAGDAIDRILDRTDGRPRQHVDVSNDDGSLSTPAAGAAEAAAILAELGLPAGPPPKGPAA